MTDPMDHLESRLRNHLGGDPRPDLPPGLLDSVAATIRSTPQVRPATGRRSWVAAIAAILIISVVAVGGPWLSSTLVGPGPTSVPTTEPSPATSPGTSPTTVPTPSASPALSPAPSPTLATTPRPTPTGVASTSLDLRGSAWRLLDLPGVTLTPETTPRIDLGPNMSAPAGLRALVFTGCNTISVDADFSGGLVNGLYPSPPDPRCRAPDVRDPFMASLVSMTNWVVIGDVLVLSGPTGNLQFQRDLPPLGDPGRALADALRTGLWKITSATGITTIDLYPPIDFADLWIAASGSCGFGAHVAFQPAGAVTIDSAGFDTTFCADNDQRAALMPLLEQADHGTLESATRVRLTGPAGEIVLTSLAVAFPSRTTTLKFQGDDGTNVSITIRDGSSWLTGSARAEPLPSSEPTDTFVTVTNPAGRQSTLHLDWEAPGGCLPSYTITIEPSVRHIWIEQLTPPGGDSLGGNCDITLQFSRPVPASSVGAGLLYPN